MARSEARIFTSIWKDQDFLALSPGAQRLYMFLVSQEELAYCGVMPLREQRWARKAAGLTADEVQRCLKELEGTAYPSANPEPESCRTPFVITDRDAGELLVRSLLRRDNAWKMPNLLKQARESASQIESPAIRAALLTELRRIPVDESPSEQVRTLVADFISDLEKGSPYPSAYPSGNPTDDPSGDPSDKDHARAGGLGESNEGAYGDPQAPSPKPLPPTSLPRDRKTGTRLPDDFTVTADMVEWFREHCPHVDGKRETERFCDYWRGKAGKDGRKLDWPATWRNWMRTAEDRAAPRIRASPSVPESTGAERARAAIEAGQRVQAMIDGGPVS